MSEMKIRQVDAIDNREIKRGLVNHFVPTNVKFLWKEPTPRKKYNTLLTGVRLTYCNIQSKTYNALKKEWSISLLFFSFQESDWWGSFPWWGHPERSLEFCRKEKAHSNRAVEISSFRGLLTQWWECKKETNKKKYNTPLLAMEWERLGGGAGAVVQGLFPTLGLKEQGVEAVTRTRRE